MERRKILVTGANGAIGGKLLKHLCERTEFDVVAVASNWEKLDAVLAREGIEGEGRISFLSNEELLAESGDLSDIWGAVHLAFSRRMRPAADIAASISFAAKAFHKLMDCGIDRVINMSSQGIYGNTDRIRTEYTPPAPETQYTMAKYAVEILFDDIMRDCPHYTSFRLDPVAQSQRVLQSLCKSAKEGKLVLRGGKQVFSFIDAEDVPGAVVAMLKTNGKWDKVYNVGWSRKRYTLVELAEVVATAAVECGYKRPDIELIEDDTAIWAGMDSTHFMEKTGWRPEIRLEDTIVGMLNN